MTNPKALVPTQADREAADRIRKWLNANKSCWGRDDVLSGFSGAEEAELRVSDITALVDALTHSAAPTVAQSVYEAAVKGRQDFRNAYRELLPVLRASEKLSRLWRTSGQRVDVTEFWDAINEVDVAVCGGHAKPEYISEREGRLLEETSATPASELVEEVVKEARHVLHDKVHNEARERHMHDATQSGFEHHLVSVAAEHGARRSIPLILRARDAEVAAWLRNQPDNGISYQAIWRFANAIEAGEVK